MFMHLTDPVCLLCRRCGRRGRLGLAQYRHITGGVPAPTALIEFATWAGCELAADRDPLIIERCGIVYDLAEMERLRNHTP